jgi:hypothetical protein
MKTQRLSLFGLVAGPFYLALGLGHALLRPGFALAHQPLSLLSVGEWGWVQIANFIITGALVLLTARGWSARLALATLGGASWTLLGFWLGLGLTWVWMAVVSFRFLLES